MEIKFRYAFPACNKPGTSLEQMAHIYSEADEAIEAMQESEERFLEELMDCYHAIETEFRKHDQVKIEATYQGVISKNYVRGYYE